MSLPRSAIDLLSLRCLKELSRLPGGSNVQSEPTGLRTLLRHVVLPPSPSAAPPAVVSRSRQASLDASDASSTKSSSSHSSAGTALTSAMHRVWSKGTTALRGSSSSNVGNDRKSGGALDGEGGHVGTHASVAISQDEGAQEAEAIDWTATDTALRCLNNAILLHETSRKTFAEDTVGGGRKVIGLLRVSRAATQRLAMDWRIDTLVLFLCRLHRIPRIHRQTFSSSVVGSSSSPPSSTPLSTKSLWRKSILSSI